MRFNKKIISKLGKKVFGVHPKNIFNYRNQFFVENVNEQSIVLDIACGTGLIPYKVSFKAKSVVGIDCDISNIEICHDRFSRENISYIRENLFEVDYDRLRAEIPFDLVIFSHILEHVEDVPGLLKRVNGEKLLICVPSQENWETQLLKYLQLPYKKDPGHFREYTRKRLVKELERAGYHPDFLGFNSEGEIICRASRVDSK